MQDVTLAFDSTRYYEDPLFLEQVGHDFIDHLTWGILGEIEIDHHPLKGRVERHEICHYPEETYAEVRAVATRWVHDLDIDALLLPQLKKFGEELPLERYASTFEILDISDILADLEEEEDLSE